MGTAMNIRYKLAVLAIVIAVIAGIICAASHYRSKYQHERQRADAAEHSLGVANATINDMRT